MFKFTLFDLFLVLLVGFLLFFLFFYTDIPQRGIMKTFSERYDNFKKIQEKDSSEKEKVKPNDKEFIKNKLGSEGDRQGLFCENSYFPFLPGAKWIYRFKDKNGEDTVEMGIPSPEDGQYFVDGRIYSLKDWTIRTVMRCTPENRIELTDLNFINLFRFKNIVTKPCEENKFAFSLPDGNDFDKEVGLLRRESGCLERIFIDPKDRENRISSSENLEVAWNLGDLEKIKVPAGEYEAKKIELEVKNQEKEELIEIWVVKEIGIVKIINRAKPNYGGLNEEPFFVQELISFQIPTELQYKKRTP